MEGKHKGIDQSRSDRGHLFPCSLGLVSSSCTPKAGEMPGKQIHLCRAASVGNIFCLLSCPIFPFAASVEIKRSGDSTDSDFPFSSLILSNYHLNSLDASSDRVTKDS